MPQSSVLAVRLPDGDLKRLDALAKKRRQTRSQLVQETLQALLDNDEEQKQRELKAMQERLRPVVEEQEAFIERVGSFADEHRRF